MPLDALLFIKPVSNDQRTLNRIVVEVPKVGYAATPTVFSVAKSYGIDGREYTLCIPLTHSARHGRDWSMPGLDDIHIYADQLKQKIPEIKGIEVRLTFNRARYARESQALENAAT